MNTQHYQSEKFVGPRGSHAHTIHVAIKKFMSGDPKEREKVVARFEKLAAKDRTVAAEVVRQYPFKLPGQAQLRDTLLREAGAETATKAAAPTPAARSCLTPAEYMTSRLHGTDYIVKGVLARGSHAVAYGPPGAGKTFVVLDLAYHVAIGRAWNGRRVKPGLVVYLPYEGEGGLAKRLAALVTKYGDTSNMRVFTNPDYDLRSPEGRQAMGRDLAVLPDKPSLIIVDTLAKASTGMDENSAQHMGELNTAVKALIQSTGACVLLVHHSGKDSNKGARGSSSLHGAIDTELRIDGGKIALTKSRDSETGGAFGFKLTPVIVGTDSDGDEIVTCTVEQGTAAVSKPRLTGQISDAFTVLCELAPNNDPVLNDAWQAAFCTKAWPTNPPAPATRGRAFNRAVKALQEGGHVVAGATGWHRTLTGGGDET